MIVEVFRMQSIAFRLSNIYFSKTSFIFEVLGGLSRCNYCENGPVLDSNQHLLLASLLCATHVQELVLSSRTLASLTTRSHVLSTSSGLHFSTQLYVEQVELLDTLISYSIYVWLFSLNFLTLALNHASSLSQFLTILSLFCGKSQRPGFGANKMLGGLNRCNYCENEPVLDSNPHLLLASLVCFPFTPTGLKLSNLGISFNPFSRSLFLEASIL